MTGVCGSEPRTKETTKGKGDIRTNAQGTSNRVDFGSSGASSAGRGKILVTDIGTLDGATIGEAARPRR